MSEAPRVHIECIMGVSERSQRSIKAKWKEYMLNNLRIVLSHPSHPGNIGAVARAMKTMGVTQLVLIKPKNFPNVEATARASGADDVLNNAVFANDLAEGILGCHFVLGTSARMRALPWPVISPREAASKISHWLLDQKVALVFGNERSGLSNEELELCQYHVSIPTHSQFTSLNLASSVQLLAYEIFVAVAQQSKDKDTKESGIPLTSQEHLLLFNRLEKMLVTIGYLDPKQPKKLMPRLKRLIFRSHLNQEEFHIFMGICKAILDKTSLF